MTITRSLVWVLVVPALLISACSKAGPDTSLATSTPPPDQLQSVAPTPPPPSLPAEQSPPPVNRDGIKGMLYQAAVKYAVNPGLVMGVAWWESGWNQSLVSSTGAVGIMQVEPATADSAGPLLLHRNADVHDAADNIELGTAILKEDLDRYNNDLAKALVAYYAGPSAVTDWSNTDPEAQRYVWGVYRLALSFDQGTGPA